MTVTQLAREWQVTTQEVHRLIKAGRLDPYVTYHQVGERRYIEIDPKAVFKRPEDKRRKK